MKKIYIAMAVVATAMLVSCEREKDFGGMTPLGENEIGFVMQGVSTRSMEEAPQVMRGETIPVGMDNLGNALFLEETIEELNPTPATKGAPAYTVNVGKLYPNMGVYAESLGDATFELMDEDMYEHVGTPNDPNNEKGWRYHHNYGSNPWTDDTTPIDFYLRMPAEMGGVSNLSYADKKIEFNFIPLSTAKDQEDLLFSQTTLTKSEHDGYLPNGAPVLMYHALTGVKFRTNSDNSGSTKTIITKVKFTGLKGSGHCVFDGSSFEWTTTTAPYSYTQTFTNPAYSQDAWVDGTIGNEGGTAWDSDLNGTSWTAAAADHNLNNAKGELTFWFIPQEITDAVKLEVTFCVKTPDTAGATGGGEFTHQINIGEILAAKNVEWKAGQLRTYTLDPKDVDVEIFDYMEGKSKTALHVTNTGNVAEYVRMLVIGNWYGWESADDQSDGKEPDILVGYKYSGPSDPQYIADKAAHHAAAALFGRVHDGGGRPIEAVHDELGDGDDLALPVADADLAHELHQGRHEHHQQHREQHPALFRHPLAAGDGEHPQQQQKRRQPKGHHAHGPEEHLLQGHPKGRVRGPIEVQPQQDAQGDEHHAQDLRAHPLHDRGFPGGRFLLLLPLRRGELGLGRFLRRRLLGRGLLFRILFSAVGGCFLLLCQCVSSL